MELPVKDFSLKHTLESGQFFLFEESNEGYEIINGDRKFFVKQENEELSFEGINEAELIRLLGLDEDLEELLVDEDDEHVLEAVERYWGLRLVRADLWQTIVGFICSSASNVAKIKMNLRLIVENFSQDGTFPRPGELNDLDLLISCKTGYRAKFIYGTNAMILENPNLLEQIEGGSYLEAKELLMNFPGIGSKVADCICLFALGHTQAFPVDTWVKQIVEKLYLKREAKNVKEIEEFIAKNFTKGNVGLKQQYLFHNARLNMKK